MFEWTYEFGIFGFFLRAIPAFLLFGLGVIFHVACARQLRPKAPSPPFLAPLAEDGELNEPGRPLRLATLAMYATALVTLVLIGLLTGIDDRDIDAEYKARRAAEVEAERKLEKQRRQQLQATGEWDPSDDP